MSPKTIFIAAFLAISIPIIYFFGIWTDERARQLYDEFYNTDLSGEIEKVRIKHHGVGLKLSNYPKEFVFYPRRSLNGNNDFLYLADKGDSVVKSPKSDTLFLIKNNKSYLYRFSKFK